MLVDSVTGTFCPDALNPGQTMSRMPLGWLGRACAVCAAAGFPRSQGPLLRGPRLVEAGVDTTEADQFRVVPALDDASSVDDDDLVGGLRRGEAVRDGNRGATPRQRVEGALEPHLGARVDGRGRLVEDEQVRVGEVGAREGDELAFTGGERLAALADVRGEAERQRGDPSRRGRAR